MPESINKVVRLRFLKKKFSTKYLLIKTFYFRVPNKRPPPRLFFSKKFAYLILPNVPTPAPLLRPPVYSGPKSM